MWMVARKLIDTQPDLIMSSIAYWYARIGMEPPETPYHPI